MRFEQFIIASIVFMTFITTGMIVMYGDTGDGSAGLFDNYQVNESNGTLMEIEQDVKQVYNFSGDLYDDVTGQDVTDADSSWENILIGGYKFAKTFGASFGIIGNLIGTVIKSTNLVHPFFADAAMFAFYAILTTLILYMIFRFMPSKD